MARTIILYALALALAAAALEWLKFRYVTRILRPRSTSPCSRSASSRSGLWAGGWLTARAACGLSSSATTRRSARSACPPRECEILAQLAAGQSNKEMARTLGISPNTVKTHVARVYEKLEVQRRVQAIEKARWLALIP